MIGARIPIFDGNIHAHSTFRFGIYSIDHSINAGLDLEMPGTNKWRTLDLVHRSIGSRKLTVRTVKARARKVLEFVQKCCKECPEVKPCICVVLDYSNSTLGS